jgi:hypothetical protein
MGHDSPTPATPKRRPVDGGHGPQSDGTRACSANAAAHPDTRGDGRGSQGGHRAGTRASGA